jgi:[ribosomal protein S5]-alanine N-acetyltransferase
MQPFPLLPTPRLLLRQLTADDIPALVRYANNPNIARYVLNIPHPYGEPEAVFRIGYVVQGFKAKSRYVFAIYHKQRGEIIGEISLHLDSLQPIAQLAYWVGEPFWGQGIATEATAAILQYGFYKLGLAFVFAECVEENAASQRVLLKNGMEKMGTSGAVLQFKITNGQFEAGQEGADG